MNRAPDQPRPLLGDEGFLRGLEQLSLGLRRAPARGLVGEHIGRTRSAAAEFAEYRPYSPGDDYRQIDWNLYGRLGSLFIRVAQAREDIPLYLLVDVSRSMDFGTPNKLDFAKRVAAALGYIALVRLDSVTAMPFGGDGAVRIAGLRGKGRSARLFGFLDGLKPTGVSDFALGVQRFAATRPKNGMVVIISDFLVGDGLRSGLEALRQSGMEAAAIHVLSPQEIDPSLDERDIELIDRENGDVIELTLTRATIDQYKERLRAWRDEIATLCSDTRVPYAALSTDASLEKALFVDLRGHGIVR